MQLPVQKSNNLLSVLRRPQFFVFSLSVIFSQIASNMLNIVLIVLTYHLTKSNFAVSILVMTFLLPQVFFSFLGGIIADAKNKRKILIAGNLARAIVLFLFFFVKDSLAIIYIFELIIAIITQFYVPAETPIIPHLVKKDQLLSANAIFGVCLFGSILIGYVAAGPAMRIFGMSGVFLFMSALFMIACVCVALMPNVTLTTQKLRTEDTLIGNIARLYKLVMNDFGECLLIIRERSQVAGSLLFLALSQVIILILATIIPDYAQKTLMINPEDISVYIFAPAAFGMIAASIFIGSRFAKVNKQIVVAVGVLLSSLVLFLFGTVDLQRYISVLIGTLLITLLAGISNAAIFIPSQTIIQSNVEEKYMSKVYGLLYAVTGIMAFLPIIMAGVFADVMGVRTVLLGIAVLLFIVGIGKIVIDKKGSFV